MREIIKITFALTISCLVAGLVIGATFIFTAKAKQQNEHLNVQQTMLGLLGYEKNNPPPPELKLHHIHRYILKERGTTVMGYLLPVRYDAGEGYELMVLDLKGRFLEKHTLEMTAATAMSPEDRKKALVRVMPASTEIDYADTSIIACMGERRMAYLLPGEFPGFKTFIKAMVALGAEFEMIGLEIIEHEEDPGLGGEITREYFKNQFIGKSFETLKRLEVVKEPLPAEYEKYLESMGRRDTEATEMEKRYREKNIHALTGATISSAAVTNGVRNMAQKFVYRIRILDRAIDAGDIPVVF